MTAVPTVTSQSRQPPPSSSGKRCPPYHHLTRTRSVTTTQPLNSTSLLTSIIYPPVTPALSPLTTPDSSSVHTHAQDRGHTASPKTTMPETGLLLQQLWDQAHALPSRSAWPVAGQTPALRSTSPWPHAWPRPWQSIQRRRRASPRGVSLSPRQRGQAVCCPAVGSLPGVRGAR